MGNRVWLSHRVEHDEQVTFLARDRMAALQHERQMKQEGSVTASSDPRVQEFKGADYS